MDILTKTMEASNKTKKLLELITKKIEEQILNNKAIFISVIGINFSYKNILNVDTYEIDQQHISLIDNNCEVNINLNDFTIIKYENIIEEYFTILQNDIEFNFYFI